LATGFSGIGTGGGVKEAGAALTTGRSGAGIVGGATGAAEVLAAAGNGGMPGRVAGAGCVGTNCVAFFGGKRGVVLAVGGDPVKGGAAGLGSVGGVLGCTFEMVGIGAVTAVDHAGGAPAVGAGSVWGTGRIGKVLGAGFTGRGTGIILADAGLSGRGGRLMRSVSRLGAFGSEPSGLAESAIIVPFYIYSGKSSMAKS
jgi:hypothetical protein